MSDLVEVLEARISEDETAARAASSGPWHGRVTRKVTPPCSTPPTKPQVLGVCSEHGTGYLMAGDADRAHIAIHDPARVLAECAAKRKILENIPPVADFYDLDGEATPYILMCLASVYQRHPDYQEGWAVDGL